ncbi:MAG: GNAT family N-acetyltransferase [Geitlerinemataceae cyanobacterium]
MERAILKKAQVRMSSIADIDALVQIDHQASIPPREVSFFDDLLEGTDTDTLTFLDAAFRCHASLWGGVDDFVLLEIDGKIAAGCSVYLADAATASKGAFDLDRLPEVARQLGWNDTQVETFSKSYAVMFQSRPDFLVPQAEAIVETVAVFPEFRGRGLGHQLMQAARDRAVELGAKTLGIMAILGNDPALRLYGKYFEPYVTYHASYFNNMIPGVTKFCTVLENES